MGTDNTRRKITQEQSDIIDALGSDNWQQVAAEFAGKSQANILATLNTIFPSEDNEKLAASIFAEVPANPGTAPVDNAIVLTASFALDGRDITATLEQQQDTDGEPVYVWLDTTDGRSDDMEISAKDIGSAIYNLRLAYPDPDTDIEINYGQLADLIYRKVYDVDDTQHYEETTAAINDWLAEGDLNHDTVATLADAWMDYCSED